MGWDSMLLGLGLHVATGESIDPSVGQQWTATDDGRRFLSLSGEACCTANIAAGEGQSQARKQTERCIKAYLGEE